MHLLSVGLSNLVYPDKNGTKFKPKIGGARRGGTNPESVVASPATQESNAGSSPAPPASPGRVFREPSSPTVARRSIPADASPAAVPTPMSRGGSSFATHKDASPNYVRGITPFPVPSAPSSSKNSATSIPVPTPSSSRSSISSIPTRTVEPSPSIQNRSETAAIPIPTPTSQTSSTPVPMPGTSRPPSVAPVAILGPPSFRKGAPPIVIPTASSSRRTRRTPTPVTDLDARQASPAAEESSVGPSTRVKRAQANRRKRAAAHSESGEPSDAEGPPKGRAAKDKPKRKRPQKAAADSDIEPKPKRARKIRTTDAALDDSSVNSDDSAEPELLQSEDDDDDDSTSGTNKKKRAKNTTTRKPRAKSSTTKRKPRASKRKKSPDESTLTLEELEAIDEEAASQMHDPDTTLSALIDDRPVGQASSKRHALAKTHAEYQQRARNERERQKRAEIEFTLGKTGEARGRRRAPLKEDELNDADMEAGDRPQGDESADGRVDDEIPRTNPVHNDPDDDGANDSDDADWLTQFRPSSNSTQVRMGRDGRVEIDPLAMEIHNNADSNTDHYERITEREDDRFVNSMTYSKRNKGGSRWSQEETAEFYQVKGLYTLLHFIY